MKFSRNILMLAAALFMAGTAAALAQQRMICNTNPCNPVAPSCWPGWAPPLQPGVNSIISGGILPGPGTFALNAQCPAVFNVIEQGTCCPTTFEPACSPSGTGCWNCNGFDPTLAAFTWNIVCPNTCGFSTMIPINQGTCLPAVVDLYFNVDGTIAALPGLTFTSGTCIHVQGIVNSCNPFNCEVLTLVNGPIPFFDQFGNFAFNLDCLVVVLNG